MAMLDMEGCGNYIGPYPCCSIITGDAKELAPAIPDESVDLIFTDPVYDRIEDYGWLGKISSRILVNGASLLCFFGTGYLPDVLVTLSSHGLRYKWLLTVKWAGRPVLCGRIGIVSQNCLWMEKGQSRPWGIVHDVWVVSQVSKNTTKYYRPSSANWSNGMASWGKNIQAITKWMDAFVPPRAIVFDPFGGMGTMAIAARTLGIHYLAFEIDPDVAERARERVRNTQPPLFVMEPEQLVLVTISSPSCSD